MKVRLAQEKTERLNARSGSKLRDFESKHWSSNSICSGFSEVWNFITLPVDLWKSLQWNNTWKIMRIQTLVISGEKTLFIAFIFKNLIQYLPRWSCKQSPRYLTSDIIFILRNDRWNFIVFRIIPGIPENDLSAICVATLCILFFKLMATMAPLPLEQWKLQSMTFESAIDWLMTQIKKVCAQYIACNNIV